MLGIIEKSLFVLILDDATPDVDAEVLNSNIGENYKNRWADKSMNIIIYKNGRIGTLSDVSSRRRADKVLFPHPRPHSSGKNEKFFMSFSTQHSMVSSRWVALILSSHLSTRIKKKIRNRIVKIFKV